MKKGKTILIAGIATAAVLASSVGGVMTYRSMHRKSVNVYPVSELSTGYWGDDISLEGNITSSAAQSVFLGMTDEVEAVLVSSGEQVRAGDVLLILDSTADNLQLETDRLTLEQMNLKLTQSEKELEKLKKTKPVSESDPGGWDIPFFPDDPFFPEDPEPEPEPEPLPIILYSEGNPLDESSVPYAGSGTAADPFRFLCTSGTVIHAGFLNQMAGFVLQEAEPSEGDHGVAENGGADGEGENLPEKNYVRESSGFYFRLEVREGNDVNGKLETAWEQNAGILSDLLPENYEAILKLSSRLEEEQKPAPVDPDPIDPNPVDPDPADPDPEDPGKDPGSEDPGSGDPGTEDPGSGEEGGEGEEETPGDDTPSDGGASGEDPDGLIGTAWKGNPGGNRQPVVRRVLYQGESLAALLTDFGGGSYDSEGSYIYTADELRRAIASKEKEIKNLKLDIKSQELAIAAAEKKIQDCYVKAKMDGVIRSVADPANLPNDGSAFLELVGQEGTYVRGYISELMLDQISIGQMVNINSWENGAFAEAEITDISPYPTESMQYYGSGAKASMYPFSAVISGGDFSQGSWVQISLSSQVEDSAMYLEKAFIRDENGEKFVYVRDENEILRKRPVTTGKIIWGSYYEIKSGLNSEEYIAFPYGKEVKDGAPVKIAGLNELYSY